MAAVAFPSTCKDLHFLALNTRGGAVYYWNNGQLKTVWKQGFSLRVPVKEMGFTGSLEGSATCEGQTRARAVPCDFQVPWRQKTPVRLMRGYTCTSSFKCTDIKLLHWQVKAALKRQIRMFFMCKFPLWFLWTPGQSSFSYHQYSWPTCPHVWIQASSSHFIPFHIHIILSLCTQLWSLPPSPPAFVLQLRSCISHSTCRLTFTSCWFTLHTTSPTVLSFLETLAVFLQSPNLLSWTLWFPALHGASLAVVHHRLSSNIDSICPTFTLTSIKLKILLLYLHLGLIKDSTASICKGRTSSLWANILKEKRKSLTCQYSDDDIWPLCCRQTPIKIQPGDIYWLKLLLLRPDQHYEALDRHFVCCSALSTVINQGHSPTTNYSTWLKPQCREELEGFSGQRVTWTPATDLWTSGGHRWTVSSPQSSTWHQKFL